MMQTGRMKKTLALGLALLLLTFGAVGCSRGAGDGGDSQSPADNTITGTVILEGPDVSAAGEVTIPADKNSATQAFITFCQNEGLTYDYSGGFFGGFGGVASTATDGWLFYVGDDLAETGTDDAALEDGFTVSFRYENYDEAFAME